jgi:two-component system, LuxR family, response regulator FixJ
VGCAMPGGERKDILYFGREGAPGTAWESVLDRHNASLVQFATPRACLRHLWRSRCDLLVVDIDGCVTEPLAVLVRAGEMFPSVPRLALVDCDDTSAAVRAMKAGALDCLEKPVERERLLSAVGTALEQACCPDARQVHLTQAEIRVLHRVLAGMTSRDIAEALHRSRRTIDAHRRNIMRKFRVPNVAGLVRRTAVLGLLDSPIECTRRTDTGDESARSVSRGRRV